MSILRYPLVAALFALFLGGLASAPAGNDPADSAPTSSDSRAAKESAHPDEAAPATPATDACSSSAN